MTRARLAIPLATAVAAALAASCGDQTEVQLTELKLDRPIDIAFACFGGMRVTGGKTTGSSGDPIIRTAQPTASCDLRSPRLTPAADPTPLPGQEDLDGVSVGTLSWFGLILQSASGTVALSSWSAKPSQKFVAGDATVLDADDLTPGINAISIGEDPIAIGIDKSGCYGVTANAGSCDLSVLDVNSAVDADPSTPIRVDHFDVRNKLGQRFRAKPAAMVAQPGPTVAELTSSDPTAIGNTCPRGPSTEANPSGALTPTGVMYIAYPSCHLVAAVDMSTGDRGTIVAGIQFTGTGLPSVLTGAELDEVSCPDECTAAPTTPAAPGIRPVALDLKADDGHVIDATTPVPSKRLVIGADNLDKLTVVELDDSWQPMTVSQIALEAPAQSLPGPFGVTALALSPVIAMGTNQGNASAGGPGQFIYAVATDHTVRVAEVLQSAECDAQIDGRFLRDRTQFDATRLKCLRVDASPKLPRRSGARGPGIELPSELPTAPGFPTSVAFVRGFDDVSQVSGTVTKSTLIGDYAIITSSSGLSFVVNVDDDNAPDTFDPDDPQGTAPVLIMPHQLRDSYTDRGVVLTELSDPNKPLPAGSDTCTGSDPLQFSTANGGPRSAAFPVRNIPNGTIAVDRVTEMPNLHQVSCDITDLGRQVVLAETQFGVPSVQDRDITYPDLRNALTEGWTMTWEGPLAFDSSGTAVDGKQIREAQMVVDQLGMRLVDDSHPFCEVGVEPFDIVQFRGCNPSNGDSDCPSGYTCYVHPDSQVSGVGSCMSSDSANRLSVACRDFLTTIRRYTVGRAESGILRLLPRKHELYATPLAGCTDDQQCTDIARYVAGINSSADPFVGDSSQRVHTEWSCMPDDQRKPINPDPALNKRCVQTCAFHTDDQSKMDQGDPSFDGFPRDADCAAGTICVGAVPATAASPGSRGVCMEGVLPPQACVSGPQFFDIRASEAFTVLGARSGYVHSIIEGENQVCQRNPAASDPASPQFAASRVQIGRIPLTAPACPEFAPGKADPITGQLLDGSGGFAPNPCSTTVMQSEFLRDAACAQTTQIGIREAPAIRFSNRAMTVNLVDPFYPGDSNATCIGDRMGTFDHVSMVVPGATATSNGYQLQFDQKAGYTPLTLSTVTPLAYPVKVVRGPGDSIWVIDDGDVLTTTTPTRGQVYRVESVGIGITNPLR